MELKRVQEQTEDERQKFNSMQTKLIQVTKDIVRSSRLNIAINKIARELNMDDVELDAVFYGAK